MGDEVPSPTKEGLEALKTIFESPNCVPSDEDWKNAFKSYKALLASHARLLKIMESLKIRGPCHVTGAHNPLHAGTCELQGRDLLRRLEKEGLVERVDDPDCGWCHGNPVSAVYRLRLLDWLAGKDDRFKGIYNKGDFYGVKEEDAKKALRDYKLPRRSRRE